MPGARVGKANISDTRVSRTCRPVHAREQLIHVRRFERGPTRSVEDHGVFGSKLFTALPISPKALAHVIGRHVSLAPS
jgi:hypothetical protein